MAASNAENQDGGAGGGQDGGTCWLRRLRLLLVSGRRRNVRRWRPPPGESLNRGRHLDDGRSLREAGRRGRISLGRAAGRLGNLVLHGGGEKVGSEVGGNEEGREARGEEEDDSYRPLDGAKSCATAFPPPPAAEPAAHGQERSRRQRKKGPLIPDVAQTGERCNMSRPLLLR